MSQPLWKEVAVDDDVDVGSVLTVEADRVKKMKLGGTKPHVLQPRNTSHHGAFPRLSAAQLEP